MVKIEKRCPICGKIDSIEITEKVNRMYLMYQSGVGYIQDIPLTTDQREFLKTGICFKCQEFLFAEEEE